LVHRVRGIYLGSSRRSRANARSEREGCNSYTGAGCQRSRSEGARSRDARSRDARGRASSCERRDHDSRRSGERRAARNGSSRTPDGRLDLRCAST
jgi:hypothetical protein